VYDFSMKKTKQCPKCEGRKLRMPVTTLDCSAESVGADLRDAFERYVANGGKAVRILDGEPKPGGRAPAGS
jgi:hypothetical protein